MNMIQIPRPCSFKKCFSISPHLCLGIASDLLVELAEVGRGHDGVVLQCPHLKCRARRFMASVIGILMKSDSTSTLTTSAE
jgi:hypothetical protein